MAYTTIDNPELYFLTKTYSGSSSDVTVTFDGSEDMQPDLVWLKKRSGSGDHLIYDSVRGTNKRLQPNATDAEHNLIANTEKVIRVTHSFNKRQLSALNRCVSIMCKGMAKYQIEESLNGLKNIKDMNDYCYHVAGVVGEMLTELFCCLLYTSPRQRDS